MKVLLDTIVLDWLITDKKFEKLSKNALDIIFDDENTLFISIISLWEMSNHVREGIFVIDQPFSQFFDNVLSEFEIEILPIEKKAIEYMSSFDYAIIEKTFQRTEKGKTITGVKRELHRDPFDRMIISHAITMDIPVISPDTYFETYTKSNKLKLIW